MESRIIILLIVLFVRFSDEAAPKVRISNGIGNSFTIALETKSDLANFENATGLGKIKEVCNTGVWVLYTHENFLGQAEIFPYVDRCEQPHFDYYKSLRSVGSSDDMTIPAAAFFADINLGGVLLKETSEGIPDFQDTAPKSVVTINTDIEFFRDINYKGPSHCLDKRNIFCRTAVCWVWHFRDLDFDLTGFMSAKVGCSQGSKFKGHNPKYFSTGGMFPPETTSDFLAEH